MLNPIGLNFKCIAYSNSPKCTNTESNKLETSRGLPIIIFLTKAVE